MSKKLSISFFYLIILMGAFFLFQIRHALNVSVADWSFPQYALISMILLFFILCSLKYYTYQLYLRDLKQTIDIQDLAKKKLLSMKPHHLELIIENLFQTKGTSRVHSTPRSNQPFYDIEMNLEEGKVLISCFLKDQNKDIPKSYLDRLYSLMKNNDVEQGAFITLGEFSTECYEFTKDKPIHLINGDQLVESISF